MADINSLIALQNDYGIGNAFNQAQNAVRLRNFLAQAGTAAQQGQYGQASNALIQAGQINPAVDLLQSADPTLASNRTQFFQPQLFYDKQGNPHYFQGTNRGGPLQEAGLPANMSPAPSLGMYDTGTEIGFFNRKGPPGQFGRPTPISPSGPAPSPTVGAPAPAAAPTPAPSVPGVIPKNVVGESEAKETGQIQAKAKAALPAVEQNVSTALATIQRLRDNTEGRKLSRGMMFGRTPGIGGAQADWISDFDSLKSKLFLDAYDALRGAGAITEQEGAAATKARTAINRIGEEKKFDSDLSDMETLLKTGLQNARKKAGLGQPQGGGDPLAEARDALARGAPRDAVIQRLQQNGIDTSGL